jgi:hypothetical protein
MLASCADYLHPVRRAEQHRSLRVPTERGWVVLAGDASHLWGNIRKRMPFPVVVDVARMLKGFEILESLADGPDHIIPGHDPLILKRFPPGGRSPRHSARRSAADRLRGEYGADLHPLIANLDDFQQIALLLRQQVAIAESRNGTFQCERGRIVTAIQRNLYGRCYDAQSLTQCL